jgi:hypothetical protein
MSETLLKELLEGLNEEQKRWFYQMENHF